MAEITNREQLSEWLKGRDREVARTIASRAALRVLPLMVQTRRRDRFTLFTPIFCATSATEVSVGDAAIYASSIAAFGAAAVDAGEDSKAYYAAAYATVNTADAAVDAAVDATVNAATANTLPYNFYIIADAAEAAVWQAVDADVTFLGRDNNPQSLMALPLWPEGQVLDFIASDWSKLKTELLQDPDQHWDVWTDWYDARLVGGERNWDLEKARSVVPYQENLWPDAKNPAPEQIARLNLRLKQLEIEYGARDPEEGDAPEEVEQENGAQESLTPEQIDALAKQHPGGFPIAPGETSYQFNLDAPANVQRVNAFLPALRQVAAHMESVFRGVSNDSACIDRAEQINNLLRECADAEQLKDAAPIMYGHVLTLAIDLQRYADAKLDGRAAVFKDEEAAAVQGFLSIAPAVMRQFPEIAAMDSETDLFNRVESLMGAMERQARGALSSGVLAHEDAKLFKRLLHAARNEGLQAGKARSVSGYTLRNLNGVMMIVVTVALTRVGGGALEQFGSDMVERTQLVQRSIDFIRVHQADIRALASTAAQDWRMAMEAALDIVRRHDRRNDDDDGG